MSDKHLMMAIRNQEMVITRMKGNVALLRAALAQRCRDGGGAIETDCGRAHVRYMHKQKTMQLVFKPKYIG